MGSAQGSPEMKKEYDFSKGKRGPVVPPDFEKTRITIRIDNDILEWFRRTVDEAGGGSYQTMMNQALREYITRETVEKTLRRVLREELSALGIGENRAAEDAATDNTKGASRAASASG